MTKNVVFDRKMFALLFVLVILSLILKKLGPGDSLDARWFYTGDQARALFASYGADELREYFLNEIFDMMYLLTYSVGLTVGLTRLYGKKPWVSALGVIPGFCDFVETAGVMYAIKTTGNQGYFDWLGILTAIKWRLGLVATIALFGGLAFRRFREKRS